MGTRKKLGKDVQKSIFALQTKLFRRHRELITASSVVFCVLVLRYLGLLQSLEWTALDQFFQLRPVEQHQERITIVAIDEASLQELNSWPISDRKVAELLEKIKAYKPRAIGLDVYRDLAVSPGSKNLEEVFASTPNLVGIELLSDNPNDRVKPPPILSKKNQVGFNNVIVDVDGKVRRGLLYLHINNTGYESFALKLARLYLKAEGITPKNAENSDYLQLGKATFTRFKQNDGGYIKADDGGYQFLSNFSKPVCNESCEKGYGFRKIPLIKILDGEVPRSWIEDRIVLIGSTAPSLQDLKLTPYSSDFTDKEPQSIAGVELQAYFIDEILSAAVEGRELLKVWSEPMECVWIIIWAYVGAITRWRIRSSSTNLLLVLLFSFMLTGSAYLLFLKGWWIPLVPALITYVTSVIFITSQIAHSQEEFKRSREFLRQVINTVADPIYVKNEKHEWIVLNDAYCELVGCPKNNLIDKLDYDFFPRHEADDFREKDEYVFQTQKLLENEEELTDVNGKLHLLATKRSLHKDAAGNLFLVGVIRDITKRKLIEEELKRTADELYRSNKELRHQEDHLRYIAYHDALTGLPNRKAFTEELHESLCWAQNGDYLLALLFVDLDGFKQVNDSLGHEMGDLLLVTVGQRLNNCLRGSDTVSRLGGDEFTIILRRIPNPQVAAKIADKILTSLTEPITLEGHSAKVSASIGISIYPYTAYNSETLLKQADTAMYRAKHLGKNRYEFAE